MRVFLLFLFFLFVSALLIISNENLALKEKEKAVEFGRIYYSWIWSTGENMFEATAYVVRMGWLPTDNNVTNIGNKSR